VKTALTRKKVLMTAGNSSRKWVGIPLVSMDGSAFLQTAVSRLKEVEEKEEEEASIEARAALERAKTMKVQSRGH